MTAAGAGRVAATPRAARGRGPGRRGRLVPLVPLVPLAWLLTLGVTTLGGAAAAGDGPGSGGPAAAAGGSGGAPVEVAVAPFIPTGLGDRVVEPATVYVRAPGAGRVEVYVRPVDAPFGGTPVRPARLVGTDPG